MGKVIFWFRRDLRLEDNHGLYEALRSGDDVVPLFIFDKAIIDLLPENDKRVAAIYFRIKELDTQIKAVGGGGVFVRYGSVDDVWKNVLNTIKPKAVFVNEDYEPYGMDRDSKVDLFLKNFKIPFLSFKDQVVFSKNEVLKKDGKPYTVFTPYSKVWKKKYLSQNFNNYYTEPYYDKFTSFRDEGDISTLKRALKISESGTPQLPQIQLSSDLLINYGKCRDIPSKELTSNISMYLRFGIISPRMVVDTAWKESEVFLNELIWREFFMMILFHFPHSVNLEFKERYRTIPWRHDKADFQRWCLGQTGYPIVDAGMRQLNETGLMHNRVRMIVASFLTKHLAIDWRWGERYFALKLLDFELSSNVGNWQWAASCGCDAVPYFRIFNPYRQTEKFDKDLKYIKKWVPECESTHYVNPIIAHEEGRARALAMFKGSLG